MRSSRHLARAARAHPHLVPSDRLVGVHRDARLPIETGAPVTSGNCPSRTSPEEAAAAQLHGEPRRPSRPRRRHARLWGHMRYTAP